MENNYLNKVLEQENIELKQLLRYLFYYRFPLGNKMCEILHEHGEHERCKEIYDIIGD